MCGTRLMQVCQGCGFINPGSFRIVDVGNKLMKNASKIRIGIDAGPPPAPGGKTPESRLERNKKIIYSKANVALHSAVTDLTGSTSLLEKLAPKPGLP